MTKESCSNCGRVWQPNKNIEHYNCPAVERGDMTANALWVKIQTGGKPIQCTEWCSRDEVGDDTK